MRTIAISGLVALAAVLGGVAVPATALAQSTAAARPAISARPADLAVGESGEPLISCALTTDCLGIEGTSIASDGTPAVPTRVERWNGSSWKRLGVAMPAGTKSDDLLGVSCRGARSCLVVGDYYTSTSGSATSRMLALTYNGTSLKPTPAVPAPKGATGLALVSLSCVTTRYCVALAGGGSNAGSFGGSGSSVIIETWNGARWTLHNLTVPTPKTTFVQPIIVSCATPAFCVLAGQELTVTAASESERLWVASWNGKKITAMKTPTVGTSKDFPYATGVSCATASNCAVTGVAISNVTTSAADVAAFTEVWNGKAWQLGRVTWPKGTKESITEGVSCYGAHSCEAVGMDGASTAETAPIKAAAVSFNRAAGTVQSVPAPSKGHSDVFASVSCLPGGSCVALGGTGKTNATTGAVMTGVWNGRAWKLRPGF